MEDSIKSFVDRTGADLLLYYSQDDVHINEQDVFKICNLIAGYSNKNTKKLNIMLHTKGGNINCAIGLVEFLKERYSDRIESIVIKGAKSSGSFIAVCADECYMHTGSVLSDFTLDQTVSTPEYTEAQKRSTLLSFSGICGKFDAPFWISNFVLNSNPHGESIPKDILLEKEYVQRLVDHPKRVKALYHVHNQLMDFFKDNPTVKKVYGINTMLVEDDMDVADYL